MQSYFGCQQEQLPARTLGLSFRPKGEISKGSGDLSHPFEMTMSVPNDNERT